MIDNFPGFAKLVSKSFQKAAANETRSQEPQRASGGRRGCGSSSCSRCSRHRARRTTSRAISGLVVRRCFTAERAHDANAGRRAEDEGAVRRRVDNALPQLCGVFVNRLSHCGRKETQRRDQCHVVADEGENARQEGNALEKKGCGAGGPPRVGKVVAVCGIRGGTELLRRLRLCRVCGWARRHRDLSFFATVRFLGTPHFPLRQLSHRAQGGKIRSLHRVLLSAQQDLTRLEVGGQKCVCGGTTNRRNASRISIVRDEDPFPTLMNRDQMRERLRLLEAATEAKRNG